MPGQYGDLVGLCVSVKSPTLVYTNSRLTQRVFGASGWVPTLAVYNDLVLGMMTGRRPAHSLIGLAPKRRLNLTQERALRTVRDFNVEYVSPY